MSEPRLPEVGETFDGGSVVLAREWATDDSAVFLIMRPERHDFVVVEARPWGANLGARDKWAVTVRTGHFDIGEAVDNYRMTLVGETWVRRFFGEQS